MKLRLLILSLLVTSPVAAQPSQASMVSTMRSIGAAWNRIAQNGEIFITKCPRGGFAAQRLAPGSQVTVDLVKTNSLMNPYVGIAKISGEFQQSTSEQDGACHPTVEAAQVSRAFWGNDMTYSFQLTYQSDGKSLFIANADPRFMTNGGNALLRPAPGTHPDWGIVLSAPMQ